MNKMTKAVFPVAGLGTRFLPATKASPKEMLPIVDKPLIQYAAEEAIAAGGQGNPRTEGGLAPAARTEGSRCGRRGRRVRRRQRQGRAIARRNRRAEGAQRQLAGRKRGARPAHRRADRRHLIEPARRIGNRARKRRE